MGQVSGIMFIFAMDSFKAAGSGSMTRPLVVLIALMIASFIISLWLSESHMLKQSESNDEELIRITPSEDEKNR